MGFVLVLVLVVLTSADISVVTNVGTITGSYGNATFDGVTKTVQKFLGIPYAQAPVGNLRFQKPVAKVPFISPFRAESFGPSCPQEVIYTGPIESKVVLTNMSEDCLSLNIYVPNPISNVTSLTTYPVMVWIHGGAFVFGGSKYYDGCSLSAFNDVIVVTLNYRLTVFGFLSTGDAEAPGNFGLWDQHVALNWIKENIASFRGDASKITIFGESAGSASVFYQSIHPGNQGLFQRGIGESGTAMSPWAFAEHNERWMHDLESFANNSGCPYTGNSSALVSCLRQLPLSDILKALIPNPYRDIRFSFSPMIDGEFLRVSPYEVFHGSSCDAQAARQMFHSVDILAGFNNMDSAYQGTAWNTAIRNETGNMSSISDGCPRNVFENILVPSFVTSTYYKPIPAVNEAVVYQYTDWSDPNDMLKTRSNLINFTNDVTFYVPTIKALNVHSDLNNATNTYLYLFSPRPSYGNSPQWITGASHAAEVAFVFGFPASLAPTLFIQSALVTTAGERTLSRTIMAMWTNFARSGNPNGPVHPGFRWPKYTSRNGMYVDLNTDMTSASVNSHVIAKRYAFWEQFIPAILKYSKARAIF